MTPPVESWKSDRRVRYLLERNVNEDESIRFVIEGMDGQCIVALGERLLVVKPGSASDASYSGLVTSIQYGNIDAIKVKQEPSHQIIKIDASDHQVAEDHTGEGPPESNFFLSDEPDSIPIAKWALEEYKPRLIGLSELVREAKEA